MGEAVRQEAGAVAIRDLLIGGILMGSTLSCGEGHVPPFPKFLVTDDGGYPQYRSSVSSGTVHIGTRLQLQTLLEAYRDVSKHEIVLWIADVPLADGQSVPEFAHVTFNSWGIGRKGYNDGVVIFIFPKGDRFRMWIQVGHGLDQKLTSSECARISYKWGPLMESGQHDAGVEATVEDVISALEGK